MEERTQKEAARKELQRGGEDTRRKREGSSWMEDAQTEAGRRLARAAARLRAGSVASGGSGGADLAPRPGAPAAARAAWLRIRA